MIWKILLRASRTNTCVNKRSFKDTGIDTEKYLAVCEQLNQEPDPIKMPPAMDSFPLEVQEAFFLHRMLSDRMGRNEVVLYG